MFVDKVNIQAQAGNGGDGVVSFRHEIYVDKGGPDGGDGGDGGSIVLVASNNQDTLAAFRYNKLLKAPDGQAGGKARKHGRSAKDSTVSVPVGTVVISESGEAMADLYEIGQTVVIAKGGKGGFGNAHFTSSVRQAPRIAEKGEKGEKANYVLELKMLADVGLVGLPNAGKSSFLRAVSNARPEIANYPFTTLIPNLGVSDVGGQSMLIADIPGLISGASQGKGLGDEFLRHISRCNVILHLMVVNSLDIVNDYLTIRDELAAYSSDIAKKPEIIAVTKIDTVDDKTLNKQVAQLKNAVPKKADIIPISSLAKKSLDKTLFGLKKIVDSAKTEAAKKQPLVDLPVIRLSEKANSWAVEKVKNSYLVTGNKIEKFAHRTDFANQHGVSRIRDIMKKMGIIHELNRQGIEAGEKIIIGRPKIGEFEY
jgi:GTP-binding protein